MPHFFGRRQHFWLDPPNIGQFGHVYPPLYPPTHPSQPRFYRRRQHGQRHLGRADSAGHPRQLNLGGGAV